MKRGQNAVARNPENRAPEVGTVGSGSPVEVTVGRLHQHAAGEGAVRASGIGTEAVERSQSGRPEKPVLVDSAKVAVRPSIHRCPVKISIAALNKTGDWLGAVGAVGGSAEAVERRQLAVWFYLEDCANTVRPANLGHAIEISGAP